MKRFSALTALSAAMACLLLFSACNGLDGADSGTGSAPSSSASQASAAPQAPTPTPTLTPTPTPTPTPAPVYDDSLISDLYDLEGTYTDGVGNEYSYAFHLPQITSEAAGPVNEAIRKDFADLIEEELAVMQDGTSLILYDVQYESYWHDDMVSLVVTARNGWGMNKYGVYHYCFSDGSAPNASALLPLAGISEEEFLQRVPEVLEDAFYQNSGMQDIPDDPTLRSQYETQYENTVSPDNYGLTMPMFVDEDGRLFVVAAIYSMAGAERYDHILEIPAE